MNFLASIAKALLTFLGTGGAVVIARSFDLPIEVVTPAAAFISAVIVWRVPNAVRRK